MGKKKHIISLLTGGAIAFGITAISAQPGSANTVQITCDSKGSMPVVRISESDQQSTMLNFKQDYFASAAETEQACQNAANILQDMYNEGQVHYLTGEAVDGKIVFCTAIRRGDFCSSQDSTELFTINNDVDLYTAYLDFVGTDLIGEEKSNAIANNGASSRGLSRLYTDMQPWWEFWK
ncbi:MAG: hypothetical protein DSM107014_07740 [Gomphosphaeria aponina SAG 52.96 = DSM 107014]|uniref:Ecp2 effector protein domain-containing protein n=1 Tax=Gomphosphaeria aponina SAG 52.96 = DSM 107014 TaxID=1521640 RepID=A0A941GP70_9CHRO|nr:hypothetical protein [Gomphosphaeria aponina SAG 52.96 = DSM 107014]